MPSSVRDLILQFAQQSHDAPREYPNAGLLQSGNIDLAHRPVHRNPDGNISTERSFSVGTDKGELLLPLIVGGRVVSRAEALAHYRKTGEHLGIFDSPEAANRYATILHFQQWNRYLDPQRAARAFLERRP
jgi:hypothetical protein